MDVPESIKRDIVNSLVDNIREEFVPMRTVFCDSGEYDHDLFTDNITSCPIRQLFGCALCKKINNLIKYGEDSIEVDDQDETDDEDEKRDMMISKDEYNKLKQVKIAFMEIMDSVSLHELSNATSISYDRCHEMIELYRTVACTDKG